MAGVLTPALLRAFQMGTLEFFSRKTILADKQVPSVVWGLCDARIQNWYINDTTHIDALTFKIFMDEIRTNWLTDGWEGVIEQSILSSIQGDKPLWDWVQSLQAVAALIIGTWAELNDSQLRMHIKSNLNATVKSEANHKKTHTEADFNGLQLLNCLMTTALTTSASSST